MCPASSGSQQIQPGRGRSGCRSGPASHDCTNQSLQDGAEGALLARQPQAADQLERTLSSVTRMAADESGPADHAEDHAHRLIDAAHHTAGHFDAAEES